LLTLVHPVYAIDCVITANAATAAGLILYIASNVPFRFFGDEKKYPEVSASAKLGYSLIPNLAMRIGFRTIAQLESTGV